MPLAICANLKYPSEAEIAGLLSDVSLGDNCTSSDNKTDKTQAAGSTTGNSVAVQHFFFFFCLSLLAFCCVLLSLSCSCATTFANDNERHLFSHTYPNVMQR